MGQALIPTEMLRAANREPSIRGRVFLRAEVERVPITCDGAVVGFYCPHLAANGRRRIGPIYVSPDYRGRGLVRAIYRAMDGPMMAAILDTDVDSARLHERAGFVKWKRFARGWYWRRG